MTSYFKKDFLKILSFFLLFLPPFFFLFFFFFFFFFFFSFLLFHLLLHKCIEADMKNNSALNSYFQLSRVYALSGIQIIIISMIISLVQHTYWGCMDLS